MRRSGAASSVVSAGHRRRSTAHDRQYDRSHGRARLGSTATTFAHPSSNRLKAPLDGASSDMRFSYEVDLIFCLDFVDASFDNRAHTDV